MIRIDCLGSDLIGWKDHFIAANQTSNKLFFK